MMDNTPRRGSDYSGWLVGVVAATALLLMPKQLRSRLRRFLVRVLAEALAIITLGLITGKAVDHLIEDNPDGDHIGDVATD